VLPTQENLIEYKTQGWCVVSKFFDETFIAEAKKRIDEYIQQKRLEYSGRDINYVEGNKINSFHKLADFAWVLEIQKSEKLSELARFFLQDDPEPRGAELFAKPAFLGLPSPDHQDNYYWCIEGANALTVWVALDPAGRDNGGVHYYSGSHELGVLEHRPSNAKGSSQTVKYPKGLSAFKKVIPEVLPGDVLIHHSQTVHGSDFNYSPQSRQGWTMQFKSAKSTYNLDMKARYEKELLAQVAIREKAGI